MQALSVAIGPAGVDYFTRRLVAGDLQNYMAKTRPPDNELPIRDIKDFGFGYTVTYSKIKIFLREGSLSSFTPAFQGIDQLANGRFAVVLLATNFQAHYKWHESYHEFFCSTGGRFPVCHGNDRTGNYDYSPAMGSLKTDLVLGFEHNRGTNTYEVKVVRATGHAADVTPNIPSRSVIQNEDKRCFTAKVSDVTAASVSKIDFNKPISQVFPPLLKSISGSGQLTPDIFYDFGVGDSGLCFPADNKGIMIGVTGKVRYKNEEYPGTPPSALPVPPPPIDQYHLNVYVSDYEMNALHWAYFRAGLLNITVTPSQLPDPDVLKVKTYTQLIPELKPYAAFSMNAVVAPKEAPVASFQEVYEFMGDAMERLHERLPSNIYQLILNIEGDGYVSVEDLHESLRALGIPQQYDEIIQLATKERGMVSRQNIGFTLIIQNGTPEQPNIVFSVVRTDILTELGLGVTNKAQTMKYTFKKVSSKATYVSSTIPRFPGDRIEIIWAVAGEPRYSETLQKMGATGVPIPIMSGFQFLFQEAKLSVQTGFVSILAKVEFKAASLEAALAAASHG
jgi:hypothetical protein